jgi:hypothetical protein
MGGVLGVRLAAPGPRSWSNATPGKQVKSAAIYPCAEGCDCVLSSSYFWKGGEDNVIELNTYHRIVVSAPAFVTVHPERRDRGLNPQEALDWRRSG